jgi:hypothetical protein
MGKFTKHRREAIVKRLRKGHFANAAARAVGISEKTYYEWLKKGDAALDKQPEERTATERDYANFREAVDRAEGQFEDEALDIIKMHAESPNGGKDMRWLLERRFPGRWGPPKEKLELSGGKQPVTQLTVVRTIREGEGPPVTVH